MTQPQKISLTAITLAAMIALVSLVSRPAEACGYSPEFSAQLAMNEHFGIKTIAGEPDGPTLEMREFRLVGKSAIALVEIVDRDSTELFFVNLESKGYFDMSITEVTEATPTARLAFAILDALRRA